MELIVILTHISLSIVIRFIKYIKKRFIKYTKKKKNVDHFVTLYYVGTFTYQIHDKTQLHKIYLDWLQDCKFLF